jgi:hypothetical protein
MNKRLELYRKIKLVFYFSSFKRVSPNSPENNSDSLKCNVIRLNLNRFKNKD